MVLERALSWFRTRRRRPADVGSGRRTAGGASPRSSGDIETPWWPEHYGIDSQGNPITLDDLIRGEVGEPDNLGPVGDRLNRPGFCRDSIERVRDDGDQAPSPSALAAAVGDHRGATARKDGLLETPAFVQWLSHLAGASEAELATIQSLGWPDDGAVRLAVAAAAASGRLGEWGEAEMATHAHVPPDPRPTPRSSGPDCSCEYPCNCPSAGDPWVVEQRARMLAGALVVRDVLDPATFANLASGWPWALDEPGTESAAETNTGPSPIAAELLLVMSPGGPARAMGPRSSRRLG